MFYLKECAYVFKIHPGLGLFPMPVELAHLKSGAFQRIK